MFDTARENNAVINACRRYKMNIQILTETRTYKLLNVLIIRIEKKK